MQPAVTPFNYIYIVTRSVSICLTMEDEYTEYMSCLKELLIHGSITSPWNRQTSKSTKSKRRGRQGVAVEGAKVCGMFQSLA